MFIRGNVVSRSLSFKSVLKFACLNLCRSIAPSAPSVQPSFNLRSVLEKEKLNGTNFMDWYRTLRIVLKQEKKEYVLDAPLPEPLADCASRATRDAHEKHLEDTLYVSYLMLLLKLRGHGKQHETANIKCVKCFS